MNTWESAVCTLIGNSMQPDWIFSASHLLLLSSLMRFDAMRIIVD